MKDYLSCGTTPYAESCVQAPYKDKRSQAIKECNSFIRQLRRIFGREPNNCKFIIKSFPHDGANFGEIFEYFEVCIEFDDKDQNSINFAFDCERNLPDSWDEIALKELEKTCI